ncbi:hypothetical protein M2244_003458 [Rhodoferax antarcticus]|uniref:Uncharacterized protein n=1 Tax=Rhodoferax antarcticus ANT.BR TaxID=1111071 RepID=A0A1Q8YH30_9BURK|nr:hypothetical protein RA876_00200 [Rhodoferax antarcticus]MCW2313703.1 hypothetical protein [Rhodoferax antarcticus]OLP07267.1 hypothetical protein BLL52_1097 [Rhodoferax antarcticus ANT.BR]
MMTLSLAIRNLLRNRRRSLAIGSTSLWNQGTCWPLFPNRSGDQILAELALVKVIVDARPQCCIFFNSPASL